jgi:hypothetical protein
MRLWSLHPAFLDTKGLVDAWRESLLAQKVLEGLTSGYTHHPQLNRFRSCSDPVVMAALFLQGIADEAFRRNYHFDTTKIHREVLYLPDKKLLRPAYIHAGKTIIVRQIPVSREQILYEGALLAAKLEIRDPSRRESLFPFFCDRLHPLFTLTEGPIAAWEKVIPAIAETVSLFRM